MAGQQHVNEPLVLAKVDPNIFEQLKLRAEDDAKVRQDLAELVDELEQSVSYAQGILSRIHSTQRSECTLPPCLKVEYSGLKISTDPAIVTQVAGAIQQEVAAVQKLAEFASQRSYYK
jgi:hypothetical protein